MHVHPLLAVNKLASKGHLCLAFLFPFLMRCEFLETLLKPSLLCEVVEFMEAAAAAVVAAIGEEGVAAPLVTPPSPLNLANGLGTI